LDAGITDEGPWLDANGWRMLPLMTCAVEWKADIGEVGPKIKDQEFSVAGGVVGWLLKIRELVVTSE
jgi:hypothetical protein